MSGITAGTRRRAPSLALLSWYFLRLSGVLVLALVFGHLFVMHYRRAPSATSAAFVGARWSGPFWLAFDWLLLLLALCHGLVGLRAVLHDYLHTVAARRTVSAATAALAILFGGIGTATIVTFRPEWLATGVGPLSAQGWIAPALEGLLAALATVTYLALLLVAGAVLAGRLGGRPAGQWGFAGQWAWALHRLTGLGVLGFLLIHILDLVLLPLAPDLYDRTVAGYASPYLIPMEVALVGAVLYHALNGVRLMLIEFGRPELRRRQAQLFFGALVATVVLLLPSVVVLLRGG